MAERLRALRRIGAVQSEMIKLAEWRLAAARQACSDLETTRARLNKYIAEDGALGATLARAALTALHGIDSRLVAAERDCVAERAKLDSLRRRERALNTAKRQATEVARREEEGRGLADALDAWFAIKRT